MISSIPRKYRTLAVRIAGFLIFGILLFHLMPAREQAIKGSGRSDESHFRFVDYNEAGADEAALANDDLQREMLILTPGVDGIIHEQPLAPMAHRADDGSDVIDKEVNATEAQMPPTPSVSCFSKVKF